MASQTIPIDGDLHADLREYCDRGGIRFVDFIEEALQNAIEREEILEKSDKANRILARADKEREMSFRRGFFQGVLVGILVNQGQLAVSKKITPSEIASNEDPFKIITGPQLDLFE